jgi:hypothetical protein
MCNILFLNIYFYLSITGWPGGGRPDSNPGSYFEGKKSTTPK